MATLITTPGAIDANSYCSRADADVYHKEYRLHSEIWLSTGGSDKDKALLWATSLLDDSVDWYGSKASSDQALRWPRTSIYDRDGDSIDSDTIPNFLRDATADFAMHLLGEDRTLETNRDLIGFSEMRVDVIEMKIDKRAQKPLIPNSVWVLIGPYAVSPRAQRTLERM